MIPDVKSYLAFLNQYGGSLPHYLQGGTGFFEDLGSGVKRSAVPMLKSIGKAPLPMATQAIGMAMQTKGPLKNKLKAGFQSATKKNLLKLGRAGRASFSTPLPNF